MDRQLNIGFITCHFPPDSIGGAQVQSYRLCDALGKNNKVTVYKRDYHGLLSHREQIGNFILQRRRTSLIPIIRSILDFIRGMKEIYVSRMTTDIYLSFHAQLAALIVVAAKLFYNTIAIVSPRGEEDFDFYGIKKILQKYLYKHSSAILIQSETIKNKFLKKVSEVYNEAEAAEIISKIYIFPNGVPSLKCTHTIQGILTYKILFVGRLSPIKGIDYLVTALKSYTHSYSLTIIGDGEERSVLEAMAKDMPVKFVGTKEFWEIEQYLQVAHVLVLPSLSENLPNALLEALAYGVPAIATRVGAVPEVINEGINGYLVEPKNSKDIVDSLNKIFESPEKYEMMSRLAYSSIEPYTWRFLLPQLQSILINIRDHHA